MTAPRSETRSTEHTLELEHMTWPQVRAALDAGRTTVVFSCGAVEQHGPHGPLLTDVLIPTEIARRVAPRIGAVVAPPINYALSYPHVGFPGMMHIRIPTFMALVEDLCVSFANSGFRRIIFLNGHYDNTYAIAYACANAQERLPRGMAQAFPVNYWDAFTAEDMAIVSGPTPPGTGVSAPAVLATSGCTSPTSTEPRFSNTWRRSG